jgi:hypothetical protein
MDILYYSTWLLAEQLRLFGELALEGCRWWNWSPGGAGPSDPPAPACGPAPPPGYFERLLGVAERIARHASFPGHQEAVEQCLEDVGDLIDAGRITTDQGAVLAGILSGACSRMA